MDGISQDSFFDGRLRLAQPRRGYRYSIDAVLLAHSVHPKPGETVVDLGTGCGIIPLILSFRHPGRRFWGVELQAPLAALAAENIRANGLGSSVTVVCADMRELTPQSVGAPVDIVVCNPPYRRGRSGRVNPDLQRALARHEIMITLPDIIRVSRRLLKTGGRLVMIYAAGRCAELLCHMRAERIEPKRLRSIHSAEGQDARLVLVEGIREARAGLTIAPPLMIYAADGAYSPEVRAMLRPADSGVDNFPESS